MSATDRLVKGRVYRVVHQNAGVQRYPRESVMKFLGTLGSGTCWDARPYAGTQAFNPDTIISAEEVDPTTKPYMNRRAKTRVMHLPHHNPPIPRLPHGPHDDCPGLDANGNPSA